jgi:hypothetical protein
MHGQAVAPSSQTQLARHRFGIAYLDLLWQNASLTYGSIAELGIT